MSKEIVFYVVIPLMAAGMGAAIGSVIAFRYQRKLELRRDKRYVLQTMMMYRNVTANELDWIKAMNAIDIVFHKDAKVREVYHTLLAQLDPELFGNKQWIETYYLLIFEMARCTEYGNLSLHDIRDIYYPKALDKHYAYMNREDVPASGNVSNTNTPTVQN
jgi:hypothetical protein